MEKESKNKADFKQVIITKSPFSQNASPCSFCTVCTAKKILRRSHLCVFPKFSFHFSIAFNSLRVSVIQIQRLLIPSALVASTS